MARVTQAQLAGAVSRLASATGENLILQHGSPSNGIAWRLYGAGPSGAQMSLPWVTPGGKIGDSAAQALATLDALAHMAEYLSPFGDPA